MPRRWLFKTEPGAYSWHELARTRRTVWDGVKNALALKHLAAIAKGDEVVRAPYPDPKQKDPRLLVVDIRPVRALSRPVTLAAMRANPELDGFDLLRLPRLSVMPVSPEQWTAIVEMSKS
jgi:predicted RNA-binding protein with PUA-like domain